MRSASVNTDGIKMILRHQNCTADLLLKRDSHEESFLDYLHLDSSLWRLFADYLNKILETPEYQAESEIMNQLKEVEIGEVKKMPD